MMGRMGRMVYRKYLGFDKRRSWEVIEGSSSWGRGMDNNQD